MAGGWEYLVRYGVMGHVARFQAEAEQAAALSRGRSVVVQTERGRELGEVLLVLDGDEPAAPDAAASDFVSGERHVLRPAGPDDRADAERLGAARGDRLTLCQRLWDETGWPWALVDIEPMLDDAATVLYYLGPRELEIGPLRARFRAACGFDVVLEPVGDDDAVNEHAGENGPGGGGCGDCGGGGCGSDAGPSSSSATKCGPASHGGCSSCGIRDWMAARGAGRGSEIALGNAPLEMGRGVR